MSRPTTVAALALTLALAGCVLLVDQSPTGDQFSTDCGLLAAPSACATCIEQTCAAALGGCCSDSACRAMLAQVDECAEGGACAFDAGDDAGSALAACIAGSCASACAGTQVESGPPKGVDCYSDGVGICSCSVDTTPNTQACNPSLFPNTFCCADSTWPTSGKCSCNAVTCFTSSSSCQCWPSDQGIPGTACDITTTSGECCMNGTTSCQCDQSQSCSVGVSSCSDPGSWACPAGKVLYTRCR